MPGWLTWYSAADGWLATDMRREVVIRVLAVPDGWDVWVLDLFCGTYLTEEMARGAAIGLYGIHMDGSALPRWAGPGRG